MMWVFENCNYVVRKYINMINSIIISQHQKKNYTYIEKKNILVKKSSKNIGHEILIMIKCMHNADVLKNVYQKYTCKNFMYIQHQINLITMFPQIV